MIRLLYIDDDAGLRRLVERGLAREDFTVETAATGPDGVARARADRFDVIALDYYMPGMDGLETLDTLRHIQNAPPVVIVTAAEEPRIAVAALKAGATDYVIKDSRGDFIPLLKAALTAAVNGERMRSAKEQAEREVREARDRFEALATERELLLREVNHRVGNSLQLVAAFLHMQSSMADNAAVRDALVIAMGRVVAVGQVHRSLYAAEDVQLIGADTYLTSFVGDLAKSSPKASEIKLETDTIQLDPDRIVAVGVIVNELVLNALKYAYPNGSTGPIRIGLKNGDGDRVLLSVEDDGSGYDPDSVRATSGLGGKIVKAMTSKLNGRVDKLPKASGTRVVVDFPLQS